MDFKRRIVSKQILALFTPARSTEPSKSHSHSTRGKQINFSSAKTDGSNYKNKKTIQAVFDRELLLRALRGVVWCVGVGVGWSLCAGVLCDVLHVCVHKVHTCVGCEREGTCAWLNFRQTHVNTVQKLERYQAA
jgi:hypothetical protein